MAPGTEPPRDSGFLPPEPAGPEPDLGDSGRDPTHPLPPPGPSQPGPPTGQTQPLPPTGSTQPYPPQVPQHPPPPYQPPPHQPWQAPYAYPPPPGYGYGPPPGWQQPPPPGWQQPPPAWAMRPPEPHNNPAVAGFALSLTGGGLLFFFAGLSTLLSLGLAIVGIIYSRKGRERVDKGETTKQRDLAQAGFFIGIASAVLSVLATLGWGALIIAAITDEEFRRELEDSNTGTIAITVARGLLTLL